MLLSFGPSHGVSMSFGSMNAKGRPEYQAPGKVFKIVAQDAKGVGWAGGPGGRWGGGGAVEEHF